MSKFCTKCGATLDDNAAFCTTCGAKFDTAAPAAKADENASIIDKVKANANAEGIKSLSANPNFTKYLGIGVVAVVAIIILCILISVLSSGWKTPIKKYFKAIEEKDGEIYMETIHETSLKNTKKAYDWTNKEQKEYYDESVESTYDYLEEEYGKKLKISYKIIDKEELEDDDLKDYEDLLEDSWDEKSLDVSKGYEVDVEVKVKGNDDDDDSIDGEFVVLKVDGDWCLVSKSVEW